MTPALNKSGIPNMQTFVWALNPASNTYDVQNKFQRNNLECIKSQILIRLSTFKGEWLPDPDFGISGILVGQNSTNPDVLVQIISDEILKVKNVNTVKIASTNFDIGNRLLSATFNVNTLYGITTVQQVF